MTESCVTPSPSPQKQRGVIDTTLPYGTVKEAVILFDEKADLKTRSSEKRSPNGRLLYFRIVEELRRSKEELKTAESVKAQALHELSETRILLGEVTKKLTEAIASKEAALKALEEASLRIVEIEKANIKQTEATYALWQGELETLRKQHYVALVELELAKGHIENLRSELNDITDAKVEAEKMVEEAKVSAEKALRKAEQLARDLSESQAATAAEKSARIAAEHARLAIEVSKDAEVKTALRSTEEAQMESEILRKEVAVLKQFEVQALDWGAKLVSSSKELAAIKEANLNLIVASKEANAKLNQAGAELEKSRNAESVAVARYKSALKDLEEIKDQLQKSSAENVSLVAHVEFLRAQLHSSKLEVEYLKKIESYATSAAATSSAEFKKVEEELEVALTAEGKAKEVIGNLTASLQRALLEADGAKALLEEAHENVRKAKLETEQAKAASNTLESRLQAAHREVEAAKAAEVLAVAEYESLKKKEHSSTSNVDEPSKLTIPKEEYDALKVRMQEVDAVVVQKVFAMLAELNNTRSKEQVLIAELEKANAEIDSSKREQKQALLKAETAESAKVAIEGELRKWRAEIEQRRKGTDMAPAPGNHSPLHTNAVQKSVDFPEKDEHVESLGQVLHLKFQPPADKVYPVEKQPTLKRRQRLLARIRAYLAKNRYLKKSFKKSVKLDA